MKQVLSTTRSPGEPKRVARTTAPRQPHALRSPVGRALGGRGASDGCAGNPWIGRERFGRLSGGPMIKITVVPF